MVTKKTFIQIQVVYYRSYQILYASDVFRFINRYCWASYDIKEHYEHERNKRVFSSCKQMENFTLTKKNHLLPVRLRPPKETNGKEERTRAQLVHSSIFHFNPISLEKSILNTRPVLSPVISLHLSPDKMVCFTRFLSVGKHVDLNNLCLFFFILSCACAVGWAMRRDKGNDNFASFKCIWRRGWPEIIRRYFTSHSKAEKILFELKTIHLITGR